MKKKEGFLILVLALLIVLSIVILIKNGGDQVIGGDRDEYGCLISAGYQWCPSEQECMRMWEEYCEEYTDQFRIDSFEDCLAAGYPAMESYPRQCMVPGGETFTEIIEDFWRLDGIELMQHEIDGSYGCFGCNTPEQGPTLCIDPVPEMKIIEETPERYCSEDFEVIATASVYCEEEQRNVDACIEIYQPVCGWNDPEKVVCIRYPCASTYSNSCFACQDENILYYTEGECPE
jgi:hypothetical protein